MASKRASNKYIIDYYDLNSYYLKITIFKQKLLIVIYNIDLLDGVRYILQMDVNDFHLLNKTFQAFNSIEKIYEKVIKKLINANKIQINNNDHKFFLSFIIYDITKEPQNIVLEFKEGIRDNNEYITILTNEIKKLRNNNMIINDLKKVNKLIINDIKILKQKLNKISIDQFNKKYNLPIKEKEEITKLYLNNKQLDNEILESLTKINLKELKELYLDNNNINDIKSLEKINCGKLEKLNLRGNKISNISALEKVKFINLKYLHLGNNGIRDIIPLNKVVFEKLEILNLGGNKISDISALEMVNFKELKELYLLKNDISDIKSLGKANFEKLEVLNLNSNQITDINVLKDVKFKSLKKLYLSYNNINDIQPLENGNLEKLELLYLYNNNIENAKFSLIIDKFKTKIIDFQI